jgi:hypothetical protein
LTAVTGKRNSRQEAAVGEEERRGGKEKERKGRKGGRNKYTRPVYGNQLK